LDKNRAGKNGRFLFPSVADKITTEVIREYTATQKSEEKGIEHGDSLGQTQKTLF
jgi:hypothetical protein